METIDAVAIAEGWQEVETEEEEVLAAWQHLINTGMCWQLQGWFGRQAEALIEAGLCTPADSRFQDAVSH